MTSRESGTAAAVLSGLPDNSVASPEQTVSDGEAFRYFPRWVEAGDVISLNGYRLKSYSMHLSDKKEKQALENHDLQALLAACVPPAPEPLDHGPGFVIVHYARDGDYPSDKPLVWRQHAQARIVSACAKRRRLAGGAVALHQHRGLRMGVAGHRIRKAGMGGYRDDKTRNRTIIQILSQHGA